MPGELSGKAAIVGIGATDFSKNSGRSELRLAAEAVLDALNVGGDYVIAESHLGAKVKPCGGVTVYFPTPNQHISDYYKDLRFAKRHGWDGFLRAYQRAFTGA